MNGKNVSHRRERHFPVMRPKHSAFGAHPSSLKDMSDKTDQMLAGGV
jgi:hypothetical protein